MTRRRGAAAYTLVETLVAVAIFVSLVSLMMPAFEKARTRAQSMVCAESLRQIGVATLLYAGEHDQALPKIEPWPSEPVYAAEDGAQSITEALGSYGIESARLKCAQDVQGPNYYKKEGSSYCWCPMANGQKIQGTKSSWGGPEGASLSQLFMCYDYSGVHNGGMNVLFADGHVAVSY